MGCENLVPMSVFTTEIQALKAEIAALKKANSSNDLLQKVKDSLLKDGAWKESLVGGLLIGGIGLGELIPKFQRSQQVFQELAPLADAIQGQDVTHLFSPEARKRADEILERRRQNEYQKLREEYDRNMKESGRKMLEVQKELQDKLDAKLGRISRTADTALSKAGQVDDFAENLTNVTKRLDYQGQLINTTARTADTALDVGTSAKAVGNSAIAKAESAGAAAAAAGSTAATAASIGTTLLSALGAIGGAAGLLSIFGYFKAVKPTLEAHESRLDDHDKGFSQVYSSMQKVDGRAREAQVTANAARTEAAEANTRSKTATERADKAIAQSNTAINVSTKTSQDLEAYKQEQNKMNEKQFNQLHQEHTQITGLINNLPSKFKQPQAIPPELLAIPAVIAGQGSKLSRIERTTASTAAQTTAAEQIKNSAAGSCQTMQPNGCGDKAIARHVNPVKDLLGKILQRLDALNLAFNARITTQLSTVAADVGKIAKQIDTLQGKMMERFEKLWKYMKMDRVLNVLSTAASIHNAAMLSRNLGASLLDTLGETLGIVGLRDADGNAYNFASMLGNSAEGFIKSIIGEAAYNNASTKWRNANRIISAGAGVVMAVRSAQWALTEGVETLGTWIARIGNGLEDEGMVSDRKWPWMREDLQIKQFSGLDKINSSLETAEEVTEQIYMTVSAGQEISESVTQMRQSTATFKTALAQDGTAENTAQTQRETESDSPTPTPDDLAQHEPEATI